MSLADIYIVNVPIHSISGTHSITEEDLGLEPGTLPPEDVATLGNLRVVDKKILRPIEKLRQKTKRLLQTGVRVGMGTALTESQLKPTVDTLNVFKAEFDREAQSILDNLETEIEKRIQEHPKFEHLLRKYAPDVSRVERRLSYNIDIYKMAVPPNDPNKDLLDQTINRPGNNLSSRLIIEVGEFVEDVHQSIQKSQRLVRQTLKRLTDRLVPKVKSFELLDSSLHAITQHLELFIKDAHAALDAKPSGEVYLDGIDLPPFEDRLNQLRSVSAIEKLIAATPKPSAWTQPSATPKAAAKASPQQPIAPRLPKRPETSTPETSERSRPVVNF